MSRITSRINIKETDKNKKRNPCDPLSQETSQTVAAGEKKKEKLKVEQRIYDQTETRGTEKDIERKMSHWMCTLEEMCTLYLNTYHCCNVVAGVGCFQSFTDVFRYHTESRIVLK